MKDLYAFIIVCILAVTGTFFITKKYFPEVVTVIEYEQEEIDENLWVRRSSYNSLSAIIDSVEQRNEVLAEELRRSGREIANYTEIIGSLNVERDSLQERVREYQLVLDENGSLKDTTYIFEETFGEQLFRVRSEVGISEGMISNHLDIRQIRDIRINIVTTKDERNELLLTFVESPDFSELNFTTTHSLEQFRFTRRELFLLGAGSGIVIGGILFLVL